MKALTRSVLALIVAIALLPVRGWALPLYFLQYQMTLGSTDSNTQNNTYDSGQVQSTNTLTANLNGPGAIANASATPTANFGLLQLTAACAINNPHPDGNGHISRFMAGVGGGADVFFGDSLTANSATLPPGTPVQIQIICVYDGFITPGVLTGDGNVNTTSDASVGLNLPTGALSGEIGGNEATNIISGVVNTQVGSAFNFVASITANGYADDADGAEFVGSVETTINSRVYVSVLTAGASYTAASGTVYPALQLPPPMLSIQPATNSGVVLSWPSAYSGYVLQQSPALDPAIWTLNNNSINQTNGTNQVLISPATGNMFLRLMKQ